MLLEMFCLQKVLTVFMVGTNDSISKTAERVFVLRNLACYKHGRPQKFSRRGQRRHFTSPYSGCKWGNANGPTQNALPFLHHRENSSWKHAFRLHLFEILFRWSCIPVCGEVILFVVLCRYCWIGVWLELSTTSLFDVTL